MKINPIVYELLKNRYQQNGFFDFAEYKKCFVHTDDEYEKALKMVEEYQKDSLTYYSHIINNFKKCDDTCIHIATHLLQDLPHKKRKPTKVLIEIEIKKAFPDFSEVCKIDAIFHHIKLIEQSRKQVKDSKLFVEQALIDMKSLQSFT